MRRSNNFRKWLNLSPIFLYAAGIPLILAGWQLEIEYLFLIGLVPASLATLFVLIQSTAYYQERRGSLTKPIPNEDQEEEMGIGEGLLKQE